MIPAELVPVLPHLPPFVSHAGAITLTPLPPELPAVSPELAPVAPELAMIPANLATVVAQFPTMLVLAERLLRHGGSSRQEAEQNHRSKCRAKPHVPILRWRFAPLDRCRPVLLSR